MRKIYILVLIASTLAIGAQTTVNYPHRAANYDATFTDGGGSFDDGTDNFGMWANNDAKQSVAFRNFTATGLVGGTATTMNVGDSFTITVSATQASYGVIGLALLSSPSSTASWDDRINNYAVQVNLNGNSGANDPWEVVSASGTINTSSIGGSTSYTDFVFKFTLSTATTMNISINNGAEVFDITLNNQNITGYSVYIMDDWNGSANANIFWKPTTEYVYAPTLDTEKFDAAKKLTVFPNPITNTFMLNKFVERVEIYNLIGKLIETFEGDFEKEVRFDISHLSPGLYLTHIKSNKETITRKLIKH
tara:strand:- start:65 stop:985 length:921 start_codon:yes stop_codon:yes gene_type:complete